MNPITSTVAASCNRLVLSPRSSPRGSPRSSPNAVRKAPFLDIPNEDKKRRDSKEIEDYKRQLAATTSKAYRDKRTENKRAKVNTSATKDKPPKLLLEEAVSQTTAEKHRKKTANTKASKSSSSASKKDKKCYIM